MPNVKPWMNPYLRAYSLLTHSRRANGLIPISDIVSLHNAAYSSLELETFIEIVILMNEQAITANQ